MGKVGSTSWNKTCTKNIVSSNAVNIMQHCRLKTKLVLYHGTAVVQAKYKGKLKVTFADQN